MRLDPDLVRKVLLDAEGEEDIDLTSYSKEQIVYHQYHLIQAGLLDGAARYIESVGHPQVRVRDLTWEGHQFLANARNDTVWNRAKSEIVKLGGSFGIEAFKVLLLRIASETAK